MMVVERLGIWARKFPAYTQFFINSFNGTTSIKRKKISPLDITADASILQSPNSNYTNQAEENNRHHAYQIELYN